MIWQGKAGHLFGEKKQQDSFEEIKHRLIKPSVLHMPNTFSIFHLYSDTSKARSSGIKLPKVHGMRKNLDPNIKPVKQHANPIKGNVVKPHIGQGRGGLNRKRSDPINQTINQPSELLQKIPGETKIETGKTKLVHSKRSNAYHKQCGCRDDTY